MFPRRQIICRVLAVGVLSFPQLVAAQPQGTLLSSRPPLRTGDGAADLYAAILDSAQSARGSFQIALGGFDGKTTSRNFEQNGIWHIDANTTGQLSFAFRGETWDSLTIDLSDRPISLQLAVDTPAPGFIRIAKITFGHDGKVRDLFAPGGTLITNFDRRGLSGGTPIGFYTDLLSNIKIPPRLSAIFEGRGLTTGPLTFVSATIIEAHRDMVDLQTRPGATFPIGARLGGRCDPDLTFSQSVPIMLRSLSYESNSGHLEASVGNFVSNIANSCIAAGGTELKGVSGNQLSVTSLDFGEPARNTKSHILLRAGTFSGTIASGSAIALGNTGGPKSSLKALTGGTIAAQTLEFGISEDGNGFLGLGSAKVLIAGVSGELAPDSTDFLEFTAPNFDVALSSANWADSSDPRVAASLKPGQITISDGLFSFGTQTRLLLGVGSADIGNLIIDTSSKPQIVGVVNGSDITIVEGSRMGVIGRFAASFTAGGKIQIQASDQFSFATNSPGPHGHIRLRASVEGGELFFGASAKTSITAGQIQLGLTGNGSSDFSGEVAGGLTLGPGSLPLGGANLMPISQGNLRFDSLKFSETMGLSGFVPGFTLSLTNAGTATISSNLAVILKGGATITNPTLGPPTELADRGVVGGLQLDGSFGAGKVHLGASSNLTFADGHLSGVLVMAANGTVSGKLGLASNLAGGTVVLDALTTLPVAAGSHIESELSLNLDGQWSGPLSTGHLLLIPGIELAASRGRHLTLAANSSYDSDPNDPPHFSDNVAFPSGSGALAAHFTLMKYDATPRITLRNGELDAKVSGNAPSSLGWNNLVVKGDQDGSYANLSELPADEYTVVSRLPTGAVEMLIASNRVMLISSIPTAAGSTSSFDSQGNLVSAVLDKDATVFNIPLLGRTAVEVNVPQSLVLSGSISQDTTIDGIQYSKGCRAHFPATDSDRQTPPCEVVTNLAARIVTSNDFLSGANDPLTGKPDDIWLDIGPKAWLISGKGDFSRGATTTVNIDPQDVDGGDCSALTPNRVPLFVGDLVKVRVEKKGISLPKICGVAEGPDSLIDPGLLLPTKPSDALNTMTAAIQLKRQELAIQKQAIELLAKEISNLQNAVDQAQAIIDQGATLTQKRADLQNATLNFQSGIADQLLRVGDQVCHNEKVTIGLCVLFGPACIVTQKLVCIANPVLADLKNKLVNAQRDFNNLQADVDAFAIKVPAAIAAKTTNLALQATKVSLLTTDQLEFDALNKLADGLDSAISDLKALIDRVVPGIDIPLPGQWKPDSVTLVVNGRDYATILNNYGRLRQGHSEWENALRPMGAGEYFVQGMRVNINQAGCGPVEGDDECGWDTFLTTPFAKMRGFSGWDDITTLGTVTVTGVLRHDPSPGADAYVSLDLEVHSVEAAGRSFILGGQEGIHGPRYIRVEYLHEGDQRFDSNHEHWKVGDTIRVTGPVKRDRDRTTFFEVHPLGSSNIARIAP